MRCAILRPRDATRGAGLGGDPSNHFPQGLGPPSSTRLQDERAEGGTTRGPLGRGVLEGAFASFHFVEDISNRRSRKMWDTDWALDLPRQGHLGGGVTLSINVGPWKDRQPGQSSRQQAGDTRCQGREDQKPATAKNKGPGKRRNKRRTQRARAQRRTWHRAPRRRCRGTQGASHRRRGSDSRDGLGQRECRCRRCGGWRESPAALCGKPWPIPSRQKAPCASGNLPIVANRARASAARRLKRSSYLSVVPIAAPRSLKLADLFKHTWKSAGPKD